MPHHLSSLLLLRHFLVLLVLAAASLAQTTAATSPKRGLVYIPPVPAKYGPDIDPFVNASTDLTWYYNYLATPTASISTSKLSFVPMLWGANASFPGTGFYNSVKAQIDAGANISYVLGFNEPDGCFDGGSCLSADLAASVWIAQIEPLRKLGVKVGSPAVTGATSGFTWLANWFAACKGGCNPDFIAAHWYGDFQGMAAHLGQINATYPNISAIWVTEMGLANSTLNATQTYYNETIPWLDKLAWVQRYSWFGAFRSPVSNIGPNATFLDARGNLTDVGAWYLGRQATGNVPSAVAIPVSAGVLASLVSHPLLAALAGFTAAFVAFL